MVEPQWKVALNAIGRNEIGERPSEQRRGAAGGEEWSMSFGATDECFERMFSAPSTKPSSRASSNSQQRMSLAQQQERMVSGMRDLHRSSRLRGAPLFGRSFSTYGGHPQQASGSYPSPLGIHDAFKPLKIPEVQVAYKRMVRGALGGTSVSVARLPAASVCNTHSANQPHPPCTSLPTTHSSTNPLQAPPSNLSDTSSLSSSTSISSVDTLDSIPEVKPQAEDNLSGGDGDRELDMRDMENFFSTASGSAGDRPQPIVVDERSPIQSPTPQQQGGFTASCRDTPPPPRRSQVVSIMIEPFPSPPPTADDTLSRPWSHASSFEGGVHRTALRTPKNGFDNTCGSLVSGAMSNSVKSTANHFTTSRALSSEGGRSVNGRSALVVWRDVIVDGEEENSTSSRNELLQ